MGLTGEAKLLRIYTGADVKYQGSPVYQKITLLCRENGIAGVSVFKGIMGFGEKHQLRDKRLFELSKDDPIIIDIVDFEENLLKVLPEIQNIVNEGLIIIQSVVCHSNG